MGTSKLVDTGRIFTDYRTGAEIGSEHDKQHSRLDFFAARRYTIPTIFTILSCLVSLLVSSLCPPTAGGRREPETGIP